jgi:predicted transposase YdaD
MHRIYLDELGDISPLPLKVALVLLTTISEARIAEAARQLLERAKQENLTSQEQQFIIDLVTKIVSYQFATLSRSEIEAMLNITFQETRVYQEIKAEGRAEGEQQEACRLVLHLLTRKLKQELPDNLEAQVTALSLIQLELLGEALLDFEVLQDLEDWLLQQRQS